MMIVKIFHFLENNLPWHVKQKDLLKRISFGINGNWAWKRPRIYTKYRQCLSDVNEDEFKIVWTVNRPDRDKRWKSMREWFWLSVKIETVVLLTL